MLNTFPIDSRLWIFGTNNDLSTSEIEYINNKLEIFINSWNTHGKLLKSSFKILHKRFILVSTEDSIVNPSGCSIDSLMNLIMNLDSELKTNFFNTSDNIFYRDENNVIQSVSRIKFSILAKENIINSRTLVFDNVISNTNELLFWEKPAFESWHSRAFSLN
ncbi:MAG: hypothetical protein IPP08_07490 [Chlorobiota bacterium]|nr:MAG: hypothetical protein IPP08_07490 [Chlorobiota bacterium]